MHFFIMDEAQKKKYSNEILELVKLGDNDFVPPLSQRTSTIQGDLSGSTCENNNGVMSYFNEMMKQTVLGIVSDETLLGFASFRENMISSVITEADTPNIYLSTILIHPDARGKGITTGIYKYFINSYCVDKNIFTRTWSTNVAHIAVLKKFEFEEIHRIPNDRGVGIDTVYFSHRAKNEIINSKFKCEGML